MYSTKLPKMKSMRSEPMSIKKAKTFKVSSKAKLAAKPKKLVIKKSKASKSPSVPKMKKIKFRMNSGGVIARV